MTLNDIMAHIKQEPYYVDEDGNGEVIGVIYCADCLDIMQQMPEKCVDLVLTDPPYGINYKSSWSDRFDIIKNDNNYLWIKPTLRFLVKILKDNSAMYLFLGYTTYPYIYFSLYRYIDIKNIITIPRVNFGGNGDLSNYAIINELCMYAVKGIRKLEETNILKSSKNYLQDRRKKNVPEYINRLPNHWDFLKATVFNLNQLHPNEKSIESIKLMIKASSCLDNLILDPFLGSGTTAVAAKRLRRKFIGIEIEPRYAEIAKQRLLQMELAL